LALLLADLWDATLNDPGPDAPFKGAAAMRSGAVLQWVADEVRSDMLID
jgi:hypothetical protein